MFPVTNPNGSSVVNGIEYPGLGRRHLSPPQPIPWKPMHALRVSLFAPLAMLLVFTVGCGGGNDAANSPTASVVAAEAALNGVSFDVRRDPG